MKLILGVILTVLLVCVNSGPSPPKVQVYSKLPGQFGVENTLLCHASGFHPPDIRLTLLKNGVEIPGAQQTDLAFETSWQFHLTKFVTFTPQEGDEYSCLVNHHGKGQPYAWVNDM